MPLIHVILILVAVGGFLYLVNAAPIIDAFYKRIINYIALVCVVIWLLSVFGILQLLSTIKVPQV